MSHSFSRYGRHVALGGDGSWGYKITINYACADSCGGSDTLHRSAQPERAPSLPRVSNPAAHRECGISIICFKKRLKRYP